MSPGNSKSAIVLFPEFEEHLKELGSVASFTLELVFAVSCRRTQVLSYWQKGTTQQLVKQQVSFLLTQATGYPKNQPGVCNKNDYTSEDLFCMSHCQESTILSVCNCSRQHCNWTENNQASSLFSDENMFILLSNRRRQLIRSESGSAYRPEIIHERGRNDSYIIRSMMMPTTSLQKGATVNFLQ